jgi:structure-specific endonuclease subunit SLX1
MLYTDNGYTYIGATVDPDRRLRQHNQELAGGARATGMQVGRGQVWKRACYVVLPEWRTALQFEWRWKQLVRTQCKFIKNPIERRLRSLKVLLSLEKPTEQAIPYDAYPDKIEIVWDSENLKERYHLT